MKKHMVCVVDDAEENLDMIESILEDEYRVVRIGGGYEAIDFLLNGDELPDTLLLDVKMPGMDGFQVLDVVKKHEALRDIPVIMITAGAAELRALTAGAADYIQKPFHAGSVRLRVKNQIMLKDYTNSLEYQVREQIDRFSNARDNILDSLANIIECRNMESGKHVKRSVELYRTLAENLRENSVYADQMGEIDSEEVIRAVPLHDIGKIGIPDNILLKPGRLTAEEFDVMKKHTTIGRAIVESILEDMHEEDTCLRHCCDIVYSHHEKFDGSGYPQGIVGEEIPLSARIMAVVDVYDALVNRRVYKEPAPHCDAIDLIKANAGTHFDPLVVVAATQVEDRFAEIEQEYKDD